MSKSKKLPIYKDGLGKEHRLMRRRIRRSTALKIKDILSLLDRESYDIPNPKTIVNDYDWCDYILDCRFSSNSPKWAEHWNETAKKISRK